MGYYQESYPYRRREPSIFDGFTLRPLPYPVILILSVISIFLVIKFYPTYEEVTESTEAHINWLLLATPLVLIFAVKWLSSIQDPGCYFGFLPYGKNKWAYGGGGGPAGPSGGGASPWTVAALIVLVLVLLQFQSMFLDSWF